MLLRDALRTQSPSLALQRAAADEIARLDALVANLQAQLKESSNAFSQISVAKAPADPASASQAGCPSPVRPGSTPAEGAREGSPPWEINPNKGV